MEQRRTAQNWKALWEAAENQSAFGGGDSWLANARQEEPAPWDYVQKVRDFLKPGVRLLNIGPGGEMLLSLGHACELISIAVSCEADRRLCQKRLAPLGITVKEWGGAGEALPFADGSFDLVLNHHQPLALEETARVLRPGGFFITQQTGGMNGRPLARRLVPGCRPSGIDFNLENQLPRFRQAGFRITYRDQAYLASRFTDIGGLCGYARSRPWEFPGFSVETCFEALLKLQEELEKRGFVEDLQHRFIVVGKKAAGSSLPPCGPL